MIDFLIVCRWFLFDFGGQVGSKIDKKSSKSRYTKFVETLIDLRGDKLGQDGTKMKPRWFKMKPRWSKHEPKIAPNCFQNASKIWYFLFFKIDVWSILWGFWWPKWSNNRQTSYKNRYIKWINFLIDFIDLWLIF